MSPKWIVAGALAIALVIIIVAAARRFLRAPLFTPGMVRAGVNPGIALEPPPQSSDPSRRNLSSRTDAELSELNTQFIPFYREALAARGLPGPQGSGAPPPGWVGGFMVHAMYLSMGQEHDYRPALARIAAPALVLHGERDLQPEADSRSYAEAIPGAQFQVIPHAGHFVFDDAPEAFAGALGGFLRSAAGGAPR